MLTIELPRAAPEDRFDVLACVVHCDEVEEGQWSLGCTFSRELSEYDLQAFGTTRINDALPDQRQTQRFLTDINATYQLVATAEQPPRKARVLNISVAGVGLLVDEIVENGALLSVELRNAAKTTERAILACVVHITRRPGSEWALGCNFIRSLSEDDLNQLLASSN
jgi:hypothetical protein